jgi:undecaprenyl-diphosphatase
MAGAVAAGVMLVSRGVLAWLAVLAALAIAFARVYIGAHYPHDVAAGLLLGAVITLVGWWALRGVLTRLVAWLAGTRLRPLLTAGPASDETTRNDPSSASSALAGSVSRLG